MDSITFLTDLDDFVREVQPPTTVRLNLTQRLAKTNGPLPARVLTLVLQGFNDQRQLVAVAQRWILQRGPTDEDWWTPGGQSLFDRIFEAKDLLQRYLTIMGYDVRFGQVAIAKNVEWMFGEFNCLEWEREGDEYRVKIGLLNFF